MNTPVDVAGNELKEGDVVAFCIGGTGTIMKTSKVLKVNPKTVTLEYMKRSYRDSTPQPQRVIRTFDAVCKVWRAN